MPLTDCWFEQDLCRARGDNFPFAFNLTDEAGDAIDITGYTFELTVDPSDEPVDDANNLFSLSGVITDAVNGRVEFRPSTVDMDQTPDIYFYDVQQIDDDGYRRTIIKGQLEIKQDVTKTP